MITQAQQQQIEQTRIDAEMYQRETENRVQSQFDEFANFMGVQFKQQKDLLESYASSAGYPPPPPGPSPAPAIAINQQPRLDEIARKMQQQFNERERSLHEEMAATRQSAKQVIDQQAGEIQRASAASTDEIRKRRELEEFAQQLANGLKILAQQKI